MSSTREAILQGLLELIDSDPWFPAPELDEPEPSNWRQNIAGENPALGDYVAVQDGPLMVTRDGGAFDTWELELEATLAYAVMAADSVGRRARRDAAMVRLTSMIAANRSVGLADPQIYAEIKDAVRDDNVPVKAAAPVALLLLTVTVQFIASSAAG